MKTRILLLLAIFAANFSHAQVKYEEGERFKFDKVNEKDVKIVLKDNYNHYLFSAINIDGMMRQYEISFRKFDQKNHLVETFTHNYGKKDPTTGKADQSFLHNYLGSYEVSGGKVIAITENYSGRAKIKEIFKHVFDKATGKFETSLVASYPIESLGKSGTTLVAKSENNNFIAINFVKNFSKKIPPVEALTLIDTNTLNNVWQKEESLNPAYSSLTLTVTNTGKVVLVRTNSSAEDILTVVTADKVEEKMFETPLFIRLNTPKAITIGSQEYLLSFNAPTKGFNGTDIQYLMVYDIDGGRMLQNNKISDFVCPRGFVEAKIKDIIIQNNEIIIFEQSKVELEIKPVLGAPTRWDKDYIFSGGSVFVLGMDGVLKSMKKIAALNDRVAETNHIYGVINIKGKLYVNMTNNDQKRTNGIYALNENFTADASRNYNFHDYNDSEHDAPSVNQLVAYFADSNKLLTTKLDYDNQMYFVSITGLIK